MKRTSAVAVGLLASTAIFMYGVLVGKYEVFPYTAIAFVNSQFDESPSNDPEFIRTNLVRLKKTRFNISNPAGLNDEGGAITNIGEHILGVDSDGQFFLYGRSGDIRHLEISLPTGEDELSRYLDEIGADPNLVEQTGDVFRVFDINTRRLNHGIQVYVSHSYWNAGKSAKVTRVSRLNLKSVDTIFDATFSIAAEDWEVVYETYPALPFSERPLSAFLSVSSGGRMIFDTEDNLVVAFGDQGFDGVDNPQIASQDTVSSYGKVFEIDVETLEYRTVAKGVRNPQGLVLGRNGRIWETEHGPEGGDEINLINEGSNYGWPYVTFGTQYGQYEWPLNANQGRHQDFDLPVFAFVPSIGVSNLIEVVGVPQPWDGDLLVSSLAARKLYRIRIRAGRVLVVEPILVDTRVRDLTQMTDGTIVLWGDNAEFVELTVAPDDGSITLTNDGEGASRDEMTGLSEVIRGCKECHSFVAETAGSNAPSLWKVYGRPIASTDFADYSNALRSVAGEWDDESLQQFLTDPQRFAPGTTMRRPYIGNSQMLRELVRYLERVSGSRGH